MLEEEIPTTVAVSCNVHALNLVFKDWADEDKCERVAACHSCVWSCQGFAPLSEAYGSIKMTGCWLQQCGHSQARSAIAAIIESDISNRWPSLCPE